MKNGEENKYRFARQLGLLTTIPLVLLSGPVIGFFIGDYLDKRFNTYPWLTFFFLMVGFIASIRQTIKIITMVGQNKE